MKKALRAFLLLFSPWGLFSVNSINSLAGKYATQNSLELWWFWGIEGLIDAEIDGLYESGKYAEAYERLRKIEHPDPESIKSFVENERLGFLFNNIAVAAYSAGTAQKDARKYIKPVCQLLKDIDDIEKADHNKVIILR